ncbi:hypothetical protein IFR04_009991 [Cadophora malorum]|uniref:RING-type domain-containing protein n=1 Tax=Cadophora malorum TaxID=108018 RepID=A0A8H7W9X6_9HELO|nr:hypothetical protein IFR04_009991 [Cadophora malorum]
MATSPQESTSTLLPHHHPPPLKPLPLSSEPRNSNVTLLNPRSQPWPHFPSDCTICHSSFNTPRPDGTIESPSLLPCSHIFGSICIQRWLESSQNQNCPNCRREMRYSGCGHAVIPKPTAKPFPGAMELGVDEVVDKVVDIGGEGGSALSLRAMKAEDMPSLCLLCRESREMVEVVRRAERRLAAEEKALEGLRVLPGLFGGLYKGSGSGIASADRKEEARERWKNEMEILRQGLRERMEGREEW